MLCIRKTLQFGRLSGLFSGLGAAFADSIYAVIAAFGLTVISTFFLTITNPMTILSFLAVFAGLGLSNVNGDYFQASALVLGVFLGSAAWWLLLNEGITLFRKKVSQKVMTWINRIARLIILAFGVAALLSSFM